MTDEISSNSESDELSWSRKNYTSADKKYDSKTYANDKVLHFPENLAEKSKKFEELKDKSNEIKKKVQRSESKRLWKKNKKMSRLTELQEKSQKKEERQKELKEWHEVKPFLNVNSHLTGAVSHGLLGPKTELETKIDYALEEGDFQKAEILSDTLANKEFAGKITKAYAAKRYLEESERINAIDKAKRMKKIRWTFDAKEKWQMKGNM